MDKVTQNRPAAAANAASADPVKGNAGTGFFSHKERWRFTPLSRGEGGWVKI
jgi:hypothetical protein